MAEVRGEFMRVEESAKRVRAFLGGDVVFDTLRPRLVWDGAPYPSYFIPEADVRMQLLATSATPRPRPPRDHGPARFFDLKGGDRTVEAAAWQYPESPQPEVRALIRFEWAAMDHWFEEDEEVYVHPRSPYVRVDILASSRHVEITVNGVKVADSHQPRILLETGLSPRYYLPLTDVRMDLLVPSAKTSQCPYKGTAEYWSVRAGDEVVPDLVWTYRSPFPESQKIAGLVAFYNERVDLDVDGVRQPVTG